MEKFVINALIPLIIISNAFAYSLKETFYPDCDSYKIIKTELYTDKFYIDKEQGIIHLQESPYVIVYYMNGDINKIFLGTANE